jgi:hypothetical protein
MEYLRDRGPYTDVPAAEIARTFERAYPNLTDGRTTVATEFREEAEASPAEPATPIPHPGPAASASSRSGRG